MHTIRVSNHLHTIEYESSSLQPEQKIRTLVELVHALEFAESEQELICSFLLQMQQYRRFYTESDDAGKPEMQIEPGILPVRPAARRPIDLKKISNADQHWTGIYFSSQQRRPRFQTFYRCDCGEQHVIHVYERTKSVTCQNCCASIPIVPATDQGKMQRNENFQRYRDEFGNYFISK